MESDAHSVRRTFELVPRGPDVSPHAATRLAGSGGELVGAVIDGKAWTWLAQPHGQLLLMMWPRGFHARFDPLELLDEQGQVVARGGEFVSVVGGNLPAGDPRSLGHERVFVGRPVPGSTTPR